MMANINLEVLLMKATNKQKPVIGLSASRMRLEGSYLTGMKKSLVNSDYVEAIVKAGGLPIIIPPTCTPEEIDEYLPMCDGILMTGGMDVAPILYGEMPSPRCGNFDLENDRSNLALLKAALAADKPILGICRGLQMLNVALGGTLYQDIPSQCPDCAGHSWGYIKTDAVHSVSLDPDSPLYNIFQKKELLVNSVHHQAVKDLGEGAIVCAKAPDGIVEGIYMPGKKVLAVQWHPEMLLEKSDEMLCLFQHFIEECR